MNRAKRYKLAFVQIAAYNRKSNRLRVVSGISFEVEMILTA